MTTDNNRIVIGLKPGEARFSLTGTKTPQVACLVRERSAIIKYLGNTSIDVRAARFTVGTVVLTAVTFRVGQYLDRGYETWWDYYREEDSEAFRIMALQEFISFYFHGDNGRMERSFIVSNTLQEFFAETRGICQAVPRWKHADYIAALASIRARFPTPHDLWRFARS